MSNDSKMLLGILGDTQYEEALAEAPDLVDIGRINENSGVFWISSFEDLLHVRDGFAPGKYHLVSFDLPVEYTTNKKIAVRFLNDVFCNRDFDVMVKIEIVLTFVV